MVQSWKTYAYELRQSGIVSTKEIIIKLQKKFPGEYNPSTVTAAISKIRNRTSKDLIPTTDKVVIPDCWNNKYTNEWNGNTVIKFGVVSDTHLCSKYQQLGMLNELYNRFIDEGITDIYNVGDITEGCKMRPGHEYELFKHGADEQVDYVVEVYPSHEGLTTHFILGNHDLSHIKNGGVDIGKAISQKRPDMKYLGALNATVHLTPKCTLELNHPLDGASYAISYSIQKMMDCYGGDRKPSILLNGHHHKAMYMFYRNIHGIECGTTQGQTPWMLGKRLAAHLGGWIITIEVDASGTIKRFTPEFIPFYVEIKNDY